MPGGRATSRLSPLADADFSSLPPTVVVTAECDPLSSDGEAYRDRICAAGGKAWWFEEPGLVHGFWGRHTCRAPRFTHRRGGRALGKGNGRTDAIAR